MRTGIFAQKALKKTKPRYQESLFDFTSIIRTQHQSKTGTPTIQTENFIKGNREINTMINHRKQFTWRNLLP